MREERGVDGIALQKPRKFPWPLLLIFFFLTAAISVSGYVYYKKQKSAVVLEQTGQLQAIADLKAGEIKNWLRERRGDALLIVQNPDRIARLDSFLRDRSNIAREKSIRYWMTLLRESYHYENVLLLDRKGDVVLAVNPQHPTIGSGELKAINSARQRRDVVLSDLHSDPLIPHIHMGIVAPLLVDNEIVGFVLLRIDPGKFLYPMIQSWPTPSPSAETLLVRREGNEVLFLNELRHRPGTAMKLRFPLSTELPAAQAVLGRTGAFFGHDYRGIAVWAVIRPIAGTSWFIVSKIDRDEIERPIRSSAQALTLLVLLLIMAAAMMTMLMWQRQNARFRLSQLEAHQASEEKFRQVFETANVGKSITQLSGEIQVNKTFCDMLGYGQEELQKKKWQELTPADEIAATQEMLKPLIQGRENSARFNKRYIHKNGSLIWGDVSVILRRDPAGKPLHFITTVVDITERKLGEETIRQEQDLYMDLVDTMPSGMYRLRVKPAAKWDEKNWRSQMGSLYSVDFVSERFCEITGISRQEFAANPGIVPDRIHPDEKSGFDQRNSEAINSLSTFSWEGRMIVPQKGTIWVRFESIPRKVANGEVIWTGIVNDISERKRDEESIRQSTALLRSILDATPFPIAIVDVQDNKIDFWSRSALALFGHTAPTTAEWYELAYPDPAYRRELIERWKPLLEEAQRSGQAVNTGDYRITCRDGSVRICELYAAFLADRLVVTFNDVTQRRKAEERLKESHGLIRMAAELSKVGGWSVNLKDNRSFWSEEVAAIHEMPSGYSPLLEEEIGFYAPEWRERISRVFSECAQKGIPYNEEMEIVTAKGKRRWVQTIGEAVRNDNGMIVKVQGAIQDITVRKQVENFLQKLIERNQAMLEAIPDIIMEVDKDKVYTWANHAGIEFFGNDAIGKQASHYFEGEQQTYLQVKPIFNGQEDVIYVESWQRRRDGEKRLLAWWCRVLKDVNGQVSGALSSARDITDISRAEVALRESERKFRETVVNLDEGYYNVTVDGILLEHNQAFNRILGIDGKKDLKGTYMPDFWQNPEDRQVYVRKLSTTGAITNYQINAKTQQGEKITVLASAHLVKGENNQPQRIEGVFMDISQRIRAELEIQRLNEELEQRVLQRTAELSDLYNNAPCGYHSLDSEGFFAHINDTELRWLGYTREEIVGKMKFSDLLTAESVASFRANFPVFKERGWISDLEFEMKRKDGSILPVLLSATAISNAQGQFVMSRSTMIDYSEQLRSRDVISESQERLVAANKELEAFSYSVSHDLRAPLRAIDGFSRIVVEEYADKLDDEGLRLLGVVIANTRKMSQLIDDLLAFSRLSRQQMTRAPLDLAALADSVFQELKSQEQGRRIEFKVGVLPVAHGDHAMLRQVLHNLLSNAIKFTRTRSLARIGISGRIENSEAVYQVRDNGVGFDMTYVGKLFGVFQRLHDIKEFEGTGVGLAIVQRIILRHGGRVWADSGKKGGTTFYFSLPTEANPGMVEPPTVS